MANKTKGGSLSGLKASNKRVGPSDKGAWITVQKKALAGSTSTPKLTKDKQLGATKMKVGGSIKKAEDGVYTPKQNRLARREKRVYDKYTEARTAGNTKRAGRLYDRLMDKQTKSINAGVNVQYKAGGKVSKKK
jgi:hypothetical protein